MATRPSGSLTAFGFLLYAAALNSGNWIGTDTISLSVQARERVVESCLGGPIDCSHGTIRCPSFVVEVAHKPYPLGIIRVTVLWGKD
jgi:hypothetical protein